jgi:cation diffusion facilitator family transporter
MSRQQRLEARARRLSYFTVGYNLLEGLASVTAGAMAGSVALVGFGFDSFVESLSGGVLVWRFRERGELSAHERERIERRALKLVGYTFWVLGAYVLFEAGRKLLAGERPESSVAGIVITALSLVVMPLLYWAKRRTAAALESRSLRADAKQTLACVLLSVGVLCGLLLNAMAGWWQADPLIAAGIAFVLFREGRQTIREGKLCNC